MTLKIDKGIWRNEKFDSGTLDISFSKNRMVVENCHFKSGDDYLLLSGSWLSKNKYRIDRIQSAYKDNYLVNAKPIPPTNPAPISPPVISSPTVASPSLNSAASSISDSACVS